LSGVLVFLLIPALLYIAQLSLESEAGFIHVKEIFASLPVRLLVWVGLSGLIFHLFAGMKHLLADIGVAEGLESGRMAAFVAMACSAVGILLAFVWVVL
jgi:succinate dehydrogenase / fumarate reductase cytochrome b subunit